MFRIMFIGGLLFILTLFGCQQSEQTQPAQTPPAQAPATPQVQQQSPPEKTAPDAAAAVDTTEEGKEGLVETAGKTVDDLAEKTGETVVDVKETAQDAAAEVKDQAAATIETGEAAVDKVVATVTPTDKVEDVVFKGSFGTVTMSHQKHADAFSCALCHGDGTPGALDLGREAAHTLCIGCHQEQKAGPTACTDCHIR